MTRKEEIEKYARECAGNQIHCVEIDVSHACEWADKTMIDKACEWIRYNRWKYEDSKEGNEIIEKDFRKAMEE